MEKMQLSLRMFKSISYMKQLRFISTHNIKRSFVGILGAVMVSASLVAPAFAGVSGWQAGNIISDAVMADKSSMSTSRIQLFLNSKVPSCDTNGQQLSEYGGPDLNGDGKVQRWEWGKKYYNQTTFTCLKNYSENGRSAAQIITDKAQLYSINPRVLVVLLQKEQGLVTDTWPLATQYKTATGYGCPDTAACDSQYFGLSNQLDWAAKMYRAIMNNSPTWYTPYVLGKNYIQYNPNSNCGGSTVNIQNRATQALYNYTPYQPNQAALDAGWGSASCGAYGNRNFYLYYTSWFGPTRSSPPYVSLQTPRWMELRNTTQKLVPYEDTPIGSSLPAGMQIFFSTKIDIDGVAYLRTKHDTDRGYDYVIKLSDIKDIPMTYSPMKAPRWMSTTEDLTKVDPQTSRQLGPTLPAGTAVYYTSKIDIGGTTYLRTKHDTDAGIQSGIPLSKVTNVDLTYTSMSIPRWMQAREDTNGADVLTGQPLESPMTKGQQAHFSYKVDINGETYLVESLPSSGSYGGVPLDTLEEIKFTPLKSPREFILRSDTYKQNPVTGSNVDGILRKGTKISFSSMISVDGAVLYQTTHDANLSYNKAIPVSELSADYVPMKIPRTMSLTTAQYKINPVTFTNTGSQLPLGTKLYYTTKVDINGKTYLRTQQDTDAGIDAVIPFESLQ